MPALLSLLSPRVIFYGILASLLLAFGIHYHNLEKQEHEAKVVAVAAQAEVKKEAIVAQTTETADALDYIKTVAYPPRANVGLKCVRDNPGSSALPPPGPVATTPTGSPAADDRAAIEYDPSGAALTLAAQADAQIKYLQQRVKELEAQMNNSP